MAGEARTFLYRCSVRPLPPAVTDDRARYRTRCLPRDGDGAELTVARDSDQVWRILCIGSCPRWLGSGLTIRHRGWTPPSLLGRADLL